jgi:hypothetical protein
MSKLKLGSRRVRVAANSSADLLTSSAAFLTCRFSRVASAIACSIDLSAQNGQD